MTKTDCVRRGRGLAPGRATYFPIVDGPYSLRLPSRTVLASENQQSAVSSVLFLARPMAGSCSAISLNAHYTPLTYRLSSCSSFEIFFFSRLAKIEQNEPEIYVACCADISLSTHQAHRPVKQRRGILVQTNNTVQTRLPD